MYGNSVRRLYACAMQAEADPAIAGCGMIAVTQKNSESLGVDSRRFGFRAGSILGKTVRLYASPSGESALIVTGVGKVAAAVAVTCALSAIHPEEVVNLGTCGASSAARLPVGSAVVAESVTQRDAGVPFESEEFARLGDEIRLRVGSRFRELSHLPRCELSTGDTFVSDLSPSLQPLIYDMEGFAAARACEAYGTPLAIVKVVSDIVDDPGGAARFGRSLETVYTETVGSLELWRR